MAESIPPEDSMPRNRVPVAINVPPLSSRLRNKKSKKTSFIWMLTKNRKLSEREGLWPLWQS
jgi:hypothetical protein